jgi:transposase
VAVRRFNRMAKQQKRIKVEEFVRAYMTAFQAGQTRDELAETLGVSPATVYLRAAELRRKGVKLPLIEAPKGLSVVERANEELAKFLKGKKGHA